MNYRTILFFILLLSGIMILPQTASAQEVTVKRVEKTVTIGNKQFYMHHVKAGETLYAIAKAYNVTEEEIKMYNPELRQNGLQAKMVIGIPFVEEKVESDPVAEPIVETKDEP